MRLRKDKKKFRTKQVMKFVIIRATLRIADLQQCMKYRGINDSENTGSLPLAYT